MDDLFKKEPKNELFNDPYTKKPIFNEVELKNIREKKIKVHFSDEQIHIDDSISTIKLKIMKKIQN